MTEGVFTRRIPWTRKPDYFVNQNNGHPLSKDLEIRYLLNEGGGTNVRNLGKLKLNGVLSGAVSWAIDPIRGRVLDFAGTNGNQVTITDSVALAFPSATDDDFSLMLWIKPNSVSKHQALMYKADANNDFWRFHLWEDSRLNLSLNFTDAYSATGEIVVGVWHHVGVTVDRTGNATFYINGRVSGTTTSISGITLDLVASTVLIGEASMADFPFDGRMDDPRIYSRVLLAREMRAIYLNSYQDLTPLTQHIPYTIPAVGGGAATIYPGYKNTMKFKHIIGR